MKKLFNKKILKLSFLTLAISAVLVGCSSGDSDDAEDDPNKITIGATALPHAEILKKAVPMLEESGITLEIFEFADYAVINPSLASGELDANFFQHTAYLDSYNSDSGENLVSVGGIHIEPIALYSKSISSLGELSNGDVIAIPNDATNGPRALKLLAENGLFTLDPSATNPNIYDITDNPKSIQIVEMDAAALPRTLDDVAGAVINTNFALEAKLNPMDDAIIMEGSDSIYANVLVVREEDKNREQITELYKVLTSSEIAEFIVSEYEGAVVPVN